MPCLGGGGGGGGGRGGGGWGGGRGGPGGGGGGGGRSRRGVFWKVAWPSLGLLFKNCRSKVSGPWLEIRASSRGGESRRGVVGCRKLGRFNVLWAQEETARDWMTG